MNLISHANGSRAAARRSLLLLLSLAACAYALAPGARLPRRLAVPSASAATTYAVTTNADGGPGSLRQAITDANANPGTDTISFNLPAGQLTIAPASELPVITDPVVIDATSQPGYAGAPVVELKGDSTPAGTSNDYGLRITAGSSTVRGLVINRFGGVNAPAIHLVGNGGNVVENCYVGLDRTGTVMRDNRHGITVESAQNRIGGPSPAQRNVISGNIFGSGIHAPSAAATGNVIQGNYIGTNAAGTAAVPNNTGIDGLSAGSLVGGTAPGAGNLISGNRGEGIVSVSGGTTVQGNLIGTDATGAHPVPNGESGIALGGSNNRVGGAEPGARNVISGNARAGLSLFSTATDNVVEGNYIGVAADGVRPLPNSLLQSFFVGRGAVHITGGRNNRIGGTAPGQGNLIAFNGAAGVVLAGSSPGAAGVSVRGNSIFSHNLHGIDLGGSGFTPNDPGDADAGPNGLQNFPVLTSYASDGSATTVAGTLNSRPSTAYDLDFYSNRACDPFGNGEGAAYLGSARVTTDAAGDAAFQATLPAALAPGRAVTATATAPDGSTSEFSACDASRAAGGVEFAPVNVPLRAIEDVGTLTFAAIRRGDTSEAVTVGYETYAGTATEGADYLPASGTLTFAPGEARKTFTVQILDDSVSEGEESLYVRLTSAGDPDVIARPAVAFITLLDNSSVPALRTFVGTAVAEGNAGTADATVFVSQSEVTGRTVTVHYRTGDGGARPATSGVDYQPVSGTLTFAPGETSKRVNIPVVGDTLDEDDETFGFFIFDAVNADIISQDREPVTITDDDPPPTVSLGDVTVAEGTGGASGAVLPVTLSAASAKPITLTYAVTPGTAAAGSDYGPPAQPSIINIAPGQTSTSISVPVVTDSADEADETFFVDLTSGQNVTIARGRATATITDDDGAPSAVVSVSDAAASDGTAGGAATNAVFTVRLAAAAAHTVAVSYATADGTAAAGADYAAASGALTFAPGETEKTVAVAVAADAAAEGEEFFFLNLSNPTNATLGDAQGRATISDGAAAEPLTISVEDVEVAEAAGQAEARFVLRLSRAHTSQVAVEYSTSPGTARPQADYNSAAGAVLIPAGGLSASVSVPVVNDALDEDAEDFFLTISNPTNGATVADAVGRATILDEDAPPGLSINSVSQFEDAGNPFSFSVSLSSASGRPVAVNYATAGGTATAGGDYQATSGTLTFEPGQTLKSILVFAKPDSAIEPDETFSVVLSNATNATITAGTGAASIGNDDREIHFAAAVFNASEGDGHATITITRSGYLGAVDVVEYATSDDHAAVPCAAVTGNALARCDYASTYDALTFAPGEARKSFTVPLVDDSHAEGRETFQVVFNSPVTGSLPLATVAVADNEAGASGPNPVDTNRFFVRMHYLDFLSREPEAGEPWTKVLDDCPNASNTDARSPSALCDRNLVSSSFFRAPEFELKGFYVFRFYRATLDRLPLYGEIIRDMRAVTGQTPEEVFRKRADFAEQWARREEFAHLIGTGGPGGVVALMNRAGLAQVTTPDPANPEGAQKVVLTAQQLADRVAAGTLTLGQAARAVADSDEVKAREFNRAFVAMQYFGYLRRDPEPTGFNNWLNFINANPQDFRTMIDGFMNSVEYRLRFGPR